MGKGGQRGWGLGAGGKALAEAPQKKKQEQEARPATDEEGGEQGPGGLGANEPPQGINDDALQVEHHAGGEGGEGSGAGSEEGDGGVGSRGTPRLGKARGVATTRRRRRRRPMTRAS